MTLLIILLIVASAAIGWIGRSIYEDILTWRAVERALGKAQRFEDVWPGED